MSGRNSTPTPSDQPVALARARLARLVAAAFGEPPSALQGALRDPPIRMELGGAVQALGIRVGLLEAVWRALDRSPDIEREYERSFGHTVRSACPPYELEYRTAEVFQQSQTLADLAGFYRAFGFDATGPLTERADHAAAQWEFLALLAVKEAGAESDADRACCAEAQRDFLEDHAGAWMPAFFARIRRAGTGSFLARVADLAEALLDHWCAHRGARVGPRWLELRPVDEDDLTVRCGAPGAVELGPTLAAAMEGGIRP